MIRLSARHAAVLLLTLAFVGCGRSSPSGEHPVAGSSDSPTSSSAATAAPIDACILTPESLGQIVAAKFSGPVTISSQTTDEFDGGSECDYNLAPGADFSIDAHRYSDNASFSMGVYNLERTVSGTTPQQIFSSASTAYRDFAQQYPSYGGFAAYPDIGNGLVTDASGELVLAGTGDCWYQGSFSGSAGSQPGKEFVVAVGTAMAAAAK